MNTLSHAVMIETVREGKNRASLDRTLNMTCNYAEKKEDVIYVTTLE